MYEAIPYRRHHINAYRPFADIEDLNRFFFGDQNARSFRTDIQQTADGYLLEADLPGFAKEDIKLDLDGDVLTINAEHKSENENSNEKENYIRRERFYGSYARSFDVSGIDTDKITAKFENGVLRLTMPRMQPEKPAAKRLNIE